MESLQSLQTEFVVVVEYGYISLGQNKSSHSTEEDRGAIQPPNTQGSCWITTVPSVKASWKHRHHSFGAEILDIKFGKLDFTDRIIPTCSASLLKSILT